MRERVAKVEIIESALELQSVKSGNKGYYRSWNEKNVSESHFYIFVCMFNGERRLKVKLEMKKIRYHVQDLRKSDKIIN